MGRRELRCEGVSGESCKENNISGQTFAHQMIPKVKFIKTLGLPLEGDPIVLAVCLAEKPSQGHKSSHGITTHSILCGQYPFCQLYDFTRIQRDWRKQHSFFLFRWCCAHGSILQSEIWV